MNNMDELLTYLFAVAINLSNYPAIDRPLVNPMPYNVMLSVICDDEKVRDSCMKQKGLVAAYIPNTQSIVYRNDLDLNNNANNSFIVHEFVHALQYAHHDEPFSTCEKVLQSEKEAYMIQQKYLTKTREFLKVGEVLRFYKCEKE